MAGYDSFFAGLEKCHKIILCSQSEYFRAACSNGFKETLTSRLDLSEDQPYHIKLMLDFLYTQKVDFSEMPAIRSCEFFEALIALYALGTKYLIPSFCHHVAMHFEEAIDDAHIPAHMDTSCALFHCIPLVYASTPENDRTLRNIVVHKVLRLMFRPKRPRSLDAEYKPVFLE
ncbi:MAG: hypothetical protein L6R40_007798, partial [Gallowayella cf. fulva]